MLTYEEVAALSKNDRVLVRDDFTGNYIPGTVTGTGTLNSSPSLWIQFDGTTHQTNIPTGMQFTKQGWYEMECSNKFKKVPDLFEED